MIISIAAILVVSGSLVSLPVHRTAAAPVSVSSTGAGSVLGNYAVAIKLYNNQSVNTSSPFQQEIVVNSSMYSSYEASNLSNIEFTYSNGTLIPSWLESGNTSTSVSTVYWLKTYGMAPNSNITVFMVFLPRNVIAFNGVNIGEAAQFSGAIGTPGFGKYNDIAGVMNSGLILQIFAQTSGGSYTLPTSFVINSTIYPTMTLGSTALHSSTQPFTTSLTGSTQDVNSQNEPNVIINYEYDYSGGTPWPNPPLQYPYMQFVVKTIGWVNVYSNHTTITALVDDAIIAGQATTGGTSNGIGWLSYSNTTNELNYWHPEGATYHTGNMKTGTTRIQTGYNNVGGGAAYYGLYTSKPVQYFHAAPPPNGVMPGYSMSGVHRIYSVTFSQTGLPSGYSWSVAIQGGEMLSTTGSGSMTFLLFNGTHNYSVYSFNSIYSPVTHVGTLTVAGNQQSLTVGFYLVTYTISFNETSASNLPPGTMWFVNITGSQAASIQTTSNNTSVQLHNGSYLALYKSTMNDRYVASGVHFTVFGSSLNFSATFVKSFGIRFNETGLPAGTPWYVNLSNTLSYNSGTNVTQAYESNGTYTYSVSTVDKRYSATGGSVTVNNTSQNLSVKFSPVLFTTTFQISGFPSAQTWFINVTGQKSVNGTGSSTSLQLMNGTYHYGAATLYKLYHSPGGTFTVNGSAVTLSIVYSPYLYSVNFTETGILTGTVWNVSVSNVSYYISPVTETIYSNSTYLVFNLTNGTYTFNVSSMNRVYAPEQHNVTFSVSGSPFVEALTFYVYTYSVNITEHGLPTGTAWKLTGTSGNYSASSPTVNLRLHNGTYTFTVTSADSNYDPVIGTFTFIVNGASENVTASFIAKTTSVTLTIANLPASAGTWYLNLSTGQSLTVHGQSVTFTLPYGNYSYTISVPGHGTVYSGKLSLSTPTLDVVVSPSQPLAPAVSSSLTGSVPATAPTAVVSLGREATI